MTTISSPISYGITLTAVGTYQSPLTLTAAGSIMANPSEAAIYATGGTIVNGGYISGGATALISLGQRFPLGDVCRVEVFGTQDAAESRFLWPPDADAAFHDALRRQAEAFAAWVRGAPPQGASAGDAVAALAAAERAGAPPG